MFIEKDTHFYFLPINSNMMTQSKSVTITTSKHQKGMNSLKLNTTAVSDFWDNFSEKLFCCV